jgi:hypothetical protein
MTNRVLRTLGEALAERMDKYRSQIELLEAFLMAYGDKLPEGIAFVGIEPAKLTILTGYTGDDRNRVLSLCGDVFGREGWTKQLAYTKDKFHWSRVIDGVVVEINDAEEFPLPDKIPVPPQSFPLQLMASSVEDGS